MVQINFALKEVNCKIVYYGPGLSGKTTNLEVVHSKAPTNHCGELTSIATEGDRTLFFDFLPLNLGQVAGMTTKFQIYTVPGQVYYNSTRKLVLQGADGIVFVADSRKGKMDENLESLSNLEENLREYGMDINTIPLVIQYNKRDLPDVYSVEELQAKVNRFNVPHFEAVAVTGEGVFPTLKKLSSMVLESLNRQQSSTMVKAPRKAPAAKPAAPAPKPAQKVPVMSGAGSQRAGSRPDTVPRPRPPQARPRPRPVTQPRAPDGGSHVRRERVVRAPDVKPIEKRVHPPAAAAPRRPGARIESGREATRKKSAWIWAVAVVVLCGGAAAAYVSGAADGLLRWFGSLKW